MGRRSRFPRFLRSGNNDERVLAHAWFERHDLTSVLAYPIVFNDALLGVLALFDRQPIRLTAEQQAFFEGLVAQVAVTVRNARVFAQSETRRGAAETLARVGHLISQSLTAAGRVEQRIVDTIRRFFGVQRTVLYQVDPLSGDLVAHAVSEAQPSALGLGWRLPRGTGLVGRVVAERRPLCSPDILADPRLTYTAEARARVREAGYRATLAVPLLVNDRVLGALAVTDGVSRTFDEETVGLAQAFADHAAIALENARHYQRAEERAAKLTSLSALTRLITSAAQPAEIFHAVVEAAVTLLGAAFARVWVDDPAARTLHVQAAVGMDSAEAQALTDVAVMPYGQGLVGRIVASREPVYISDIQADERWVNQRLARAAGLHAFAGLPLLTPDGCVGVLAVLFGERPPFTSEEHELMRLLADHAAIAIANARLLQEVKSALEFLQSIAENSADGIVTTDLRGKITYASAGVEAILGYHPDTLRDRRAAQYYQSGREEAQAIMERLRAVQKVSDYETRLRAADGRWVNVSMSLSLLSDATGASIGTLGIVKDITERKRSETALQETEEQLRQAQKLESIGQLAGGIAHDFNNLLTVVIGRTEVLQERLADQPAVRQDIETIQATANRAALLTRQLLAFSRKQVLQPKILDLNAVVANMRILLGPVIGETIDLIVTPDPHLGHVEADPGQIEQVIVNLLVNARDAMPQGGRITIETANADLDQAYMTQHTGVRPGPYVMLAVRDTGCGMDAETRARIFEPFFTTKPLGQGTGLGLSTVYGIVKQSGGHIWVYSEPGQGTTFKIYLPRVAVGPSLHDAGAAEPEPGSETVLVVEDDPEVRMLTRDLLKARGYTVLEACDGPAACEVSDRYPEAIHLLITDMVMPGMNGSEVARLLGARRPDLRVLYMSGYAPDAVFTGGQAGAVAFIQKPFGFDGLARKVREVLDR